MLATVGAATTALGHFLSDYAQTALPYRAESPAADTKDNLVKIDPDKLTFREVCDIEDKAGMGIADVFRQQSTRGLAALVWVIRRRDEPAFSWEDALDLEIGVTDSIFEKAASNGLGGPDEDDDAVDPTREGSDVGSVST